jgi:hypothetical protein
MRILIAFFLLALFSFQALPVRDLGKIWTKAKVCMVDDCNEDEGCDAPEGSKVKKDTSVFKEYTTPPSAGADRLAIQAAQQIMLHRPDHLPVLYAGEVLTPPPNHC